VMTAPPNGGDTAMALTTIRCEQLEEDLVLWARPQWETA
jgi:hypothetical protein